MLKLIVFVFFFPSFFLLQDPHNRSIKEIQLVLGLPTTLFDKIEVKDFDLEVFNLKIERRVPFRDIMAIITLFYFTFFIYFHLLFHFIDVNFFSFFPRRESPVK